MARLPRGSQASQRSPPNESEALLLLWVFGGRGEQEGDRVEAVCRESVDLPFGLQEFGRGVWGQAAAGWRLLRGSENGGVCSEERACPWLLRC